MVILIDDDPDFAEIVEIHLRHAGVKDLVSFSSPVEALRSLEELGCPEYVITDFEMPDLNGAQVLDAVIERFPQTYGIIMSGNPGAVPDGYPVLAKTGVGFFSTLVDLVQGSEHLSPVTHPLHP